MCAGVGTRGVLTLARERITRIVENNDGTAEVGGTRHRLHARGTIYQTTDRIQW